MILRDGSAMPQSLPAAGEANAMNAPNSSGKSRLQRMLDYRNRAEEMRIIAEDMHPEPRKFMLSIAAGYDRAADAMHAMLQSAELRH